MSNYVPRLTKPEKGNKYYIRKTTGGYSDAILGNPRDPDCNVLANCVGYAYGRFNEIGAYGSCKYLAPVNANDFLKYKGDCDVGWEPKLGACMVWTGGKSGHVAIVEVIIDKDTIQTSESSYGGEAFYVRTRHRGENNNWEQGDAFKFAGFIYNPAVKDELKELKVGDIVTFVGGKHYVSQNGTIGFSCKAGLAEITKIKRGAKHPYHLVRVKGKGSNVWGWVNACDILEEENVDCKVGDTVYFNGGTQYEWQGAKDGVPATAGKATITKIYTDGSAHPYHLIRIKGEGSNVWGFVDEGSFEVEK